MNWLTVNLREKWGEYIDAAVEVLQAVERGDKPEVVESLAKTCGSKMDSFCAFYRE